GANDNRAWENTIRIGSDSEARYALYMYKGEDEAEAEGNEDGRPKYNTVYNNEIYTELDEAWRMIEADSNIFFGNTFHNGSKATFEDCVDNKVNRNTYPEGFTFE
ncbi:unnamed protein product, partial [Ascophyllum nodosum]